LLQLLQLQQDATACSSEGKSQLQQGQLQQGLAATVAVAARASRSCSKGCRSKPLLQLLQQLQLQQDAAACCSEAATAARRAQHSADPRALTCF
jgi:hypothetical protein